MAKQASVVQDGVDQVREAVRRVDQGFRRIQKQVETRRRRLAKEVTSRRRLIEKRAQRELGRIQKQIQKQPIVKRAEALRADATTPTALASPPVPSGSPHDTTSESRVPLSAMRAGDACGC